MKLITTCNSCKHPIGIKSNATTRPYLEQELGEYFSVNCSNCANNSKKHINEVVAIENGIYLAVGLIVGLILTVIFFFMLGALALASFTIPILIWKSQSSSVHTFNSYMITRSQ